VPSGSGGHAWHDELRLRLQRRAPSNLRRHALRLVIRVGVLVVADLAAFAAARAVVRLVRDHAFLGGDVAALVQVRFPPGFLNGWQFAAALLLGLFVTGNYDAGDRRRNPARLLAGCAFAATLAFWTAFWGREAGPTLLRYVATTLVVWLGVTAERLSIDLFVRHAVRRHPAPLRTLVIGVRPAVSTGAGSLLDSDDSAIEVVGCVAVSAGQVGSNTVGNLADLRRLVVDHRVAALLLADRLTDQAFRHVAEVAAAAGCQLLSVPERFRLAGVWAEMLWIRGQPLVQLSAPSLRLWQLCLKRVFELALTTVGLLVVAPVMLLIAAAVRLESPGPVFFRQERVGSGGRSFRVFKFRTMYNGVPDTPHRELVTRMLRGDDAGAAHVAQDGTPVYKLVGDSRVTGIGRWLRRTSLDELPQLFNVFAGDMSLVGPRPPLPYEVAEYDHWQFDRLQVRPGITGLWQVSGRNQFSYRQMCELDLEYVRRWSLWLDVKILFKTVPVVLANSGRAA
jgi:exopolysaccharide biosynthesis polyprenyl glycosylphosphotransferase